MIKKTVISAATIVMPRAHRKELTGLKALKGIGRIGSRARRLGLKMQSTFPGCGIFGVEMFYLETGELLINEIAPRPHNSGHYTIDACVTSQFEAHLRSILDLPMPKNFTSFSTITTNAIMLNVLG
ncbi:ATP-grasp domain protein, partial [Streptococcus equinus ATCC 9812]